MTTQPCGLGRRISLRYLS